MAILTGDRLRTLAGTEEIDYTLLKALLSSYKHPRTKISAWLADGTLIRVKKGLYVFGPQCARTAYCTETLANLIYGPSAISLEYALSFYGLIPERAYEITSITPKKNKRFNTPIGVFSYHYLHLEKYVVGVTQYFLNETHPMLIATPEKALADFFYCRCQNVVFNTIDDMVSFLRDDLRADNEVLLELNLTSIAEIQAKYKLKALTWVSEIIRRKIKYE